MIAAVCRHSGRGLKTAEYDGIIIYSLPRRAGARVLRRVETDALLAGCRYYIPTADAAFLASGPLRALDAREYLLLRLPDAALLAASLWGRSPRRRRLRCRARFTRVCSTARRARRGLAGWK